MQAIEFETLIKHGAIQIPQQFHSMDNVSAKVIVLFSEPETQGNYNKENLLKAFSNAQKIGAFKNITDPVAWQKQLRDEWE